jgi:hypothetical protein
MSVHMLISFPFESQAGNGGTSALIKNAHIEAETTADAMIQLEAMVEEYYLNQIKSKVGNIIIGFTPDDEPQAVSLLPLHEEYRAKVSISVGIEKKPPKKMKKEPA